MKVPGILKTILPIAASFIPGIGPIAGPLVAAAMSAMDKKNIAKGLRSGDMAGWQAANVANHPNQTDVSGATSNWAQDPNTGQWGNVQKFGPEEQARRDTWNQMMASRMKQAQGIDMSIYNKPINYQSWQQPKYNWQTGQQASMGGGALGGG